MKKQLSTKKALMLSVLSLCLCLAMLLGTTFAWFTDEVTSSGNIIQTGTLDIEMMWAYGDEDPDTVVWNDASKGTIFNSKLWEPGFTDAKHMNIINNGTLALKYQLRIEPNGTVSKLADVIDVYFIEGATQLVRADLEALTPVGSLADVIKEGIAYGNLTAGENRTFTIVLKMQETAGNEYQNLAIGTDFAIKLIATQLTYEVDSFGPEYDGGAMWLGDIDVSWYDPDATEYTLNDPEDLAGFAAIVNGTAVAPVATYAAEAATIQDSFAGKTVKLASDLNLNGINWTPIGNWDNVFCGTFDGQGHTIYNLYINDPAGEGIGLFGVVENAVIKGLTLENVNINAYSMVAALAGAAYPANISDCLITGDINIIAEWAYVGGIAGYCYYGTQVDGCSVIAEGTGVLMSEARNAVGGITAWLLEGDHKVTNCQVKNLKLTGWTNVGSITGFVHYNNTISGCTVENVVLNKTRQDGNPGIGLIAGGYSYSAKNAIALSNNTVKTAILNGTHIAYSSYNSLYGSEYGGSLDANFVLENNTTENITNNLIEVTVIKTADELKAAFTNGGTYALANKVGVEDWTLSLTETLTVPAGVDVILYLNGKTISGTFENVSNSNKILFNVKGNLTVNGEGTVTMNTTGIDMGWSAMGCTICVDGGDLTVNNATILNEGGTSMSYALDTNPWNSSSNKVLDVVLNNATIESTQYRGIRVRDNGPYLVKLVANDSTIDEIWYQEYSNGDNVNKGNYGLLVEVHLNNTTADVSRVKEPGVLFINEVEAVTNVADLRTALDNATGTKTIVLGANIEGDVTVTQKENVVITIDGNGKTFAGTILVNGQSKAYPTAGLTIKNVNFDAKGIAAASIQMGGNNDIRYISNLTVENCTFVGNYPDEEKSAIKSYTGGDKNLTVIGCTATNMHTLVQVKNAAGLTVTDCTVINGKNGISAGTSSAVTITGCDIKAEGYGIRLESNDPAVTNPAIVIADCDIEAFIPVVMRNANRDASVTFNGTNKMTETNNEGLWFAIGTEEYGDVNKAGLTAASGKITVTLNDTGLAASGVYGAN